MENNKFEKKIKQKPPCMYYKWVGGTCTSGIRIIALQ